MRRLMVVVAALMMVALAASAAAQRPALGRRGEMLEQHLEECEVCAKKAAEIESLEVDLRDLEVARQRLLDKRIDQKLASLADAHPDQAENIERLRLMHKKVVDMRDELRSLQRQAHDLIAEIDMTPDERRELQRAAGSGMPSVARERPWVGRRDADRPEVAGRVERWEEQRQRRLERLKEEDPEMHEVAVKQDEIRGKVAEARRDLFETAREHLSAVRDEDRN